MFIGIFILSVFGVLGSFCMAPGAPVNHQYMSKNSENFIVGGQNAVPGQFPHAVSLRNTSNVHFCGGSIITDRWIISAAHCTMARTPENTWIIVGALQLSTGGTNVYTNRIINHPDFYPLDEAGDISLLETRDTLIFSSTVYPLDLSPQYIGPDVVATVCGWGRTGPNDPFPDTLQWLSKSTITNEECYERLPGIDAEILQDNMICTLTPPGQGMCSGDSGGVLFIGNTAIGVVSWGIWPCGQEHPDVFTRISTYYNWLLVQMET